MADKLYSQYIDKIEVAGFDSAGFRHFTPDQWSLTDLKPVNLFIGPNNGGKSRLIRHLYNNETLGVDSGHCSIDHFIAETRASLRHKLATILRMGKEYLINERHYVGLPTTKLNATHQNIETVVTTVFAQACVLNLQTIRQCLADAIEQDVDRNSDAYLADYHDYVKQKQAILFDNIDTEKYQFLSDFDKHYFDRVYIPILRGLRPLAETTASLPTPAGTRDKTSIDLYQARTMADYGLKHTEAEQHGAGEIKNRINARIFTGLGIYDDLINGLLGEHRQRDKIREYERYLSKNFFENQSITLTPRAKEDVVYIKIGEQPDRSIFNLGDGLQTIITLTFAVFLADRPTLFFIEEPETHLHPCLQRTLIEALLYNQQHQYFITTHSNHLIDLAQEKDEVAIHRVYQLQAEQSITIVESLAKDSELLYDSGVRASSVLLANCSIWVERITDKRYLRAYMAKYIAQLRARGSAEALQQAAKLETYKENLHYTFTEYRGGNVTNWGDNGGQSRINLTPNQTITQIPKIDSTLTPIIKLCDRALLIADGDIKDIDKGERVAGLKALLGDKFLLLDFKGIENTIPEVIMQAAADECWAGFGTTVTQQVKFSSMDIRESDYKNANDIGEYLEGLVENPAAEGYFFKSRSGTIKDKVKFCRLVIKQMDEVEWALSPELSALCQKIFDHIQSNN